MAERHTRQGLARGQWEAEVQRRREGDDDGADLTGRKSPRGGEKTVGTSYMNGAPIPCRLCQPGEPCSFH